VLSNLAIPVLDVLAQNPNKFSIVE